MIRRMLPLIALLVAFTLIGCQNKTGIVKEEGPHPGKVPLGEFRKMLAGFGNRFSIVIGDTADDIIAQGESDLARKALLLKMRTIPVMTEAVYDPQAFEAALQAWRICAQLRYHFTEGTGREAFRQFQPKVVEAARNLESNIVAVVRKAATEEEIAKATKQMERWIRDHPLPGEIALGRARTTVPKSDDSINLMATVFAAPLSPFEALEGLDKGATALHEIALTGQQAAETVQNLPRQIRWETELLAYNLEDRRSVKGVLADISKISNSADRLSKTAKDLLPQMRKTIDGVIADIDKSKIVSKTVDDVRGALKEAKSITDDTRKTVVDVQNTITDVRASIKEAKPTLQTANSTAESLAKAGDAWTATFKVIDGWVNPPKKPEPEPKPEKKGRPFDILDYDKTAESLADAAVKMRQLVETARDLVESPKLAGRIKEVDQATQKTVSALVDHIAWRLGQLGAFWVLLLLAYRVIVSLWLRPRGAVSDAPSPRA